MEYMESQMQNEIERGIRDQEDNWWDTVTTGDQRERLWASLHNLICNPSIEEIPLVMEEVVSIMSTPVPSDQAGNGWVYWNPYSGEEYAPNHPVASGECVDAERVRKSTPQEDTLHDAYQAEFQRAEKLAEAGWQDITTAPKDGSIIDLWVDDGRHTNAYWGRPHHTCGEAGRYCDCCPSYDAWVCADLNHYLTGEEGYADDPTHWMPLPTAPTLTAGEGGGDEAR